ncbi:hypothetical protein TW65_05727 [Stemphylium lycopersici]|uniref:Uncharacterized protein n=1 Tax=Stemphylium lycopersici TaxID=183478 RepID=A0A364N721_STELY|nr:hypothetical protein TW65_05727 [Stemphylium lycopersici]RAR12831.1 hypothetical protein DDE83_003866 [Stemphylium lycopersici]
MARCGGSMEYHDYAAHRVAAGVAIALVVANLVCFAPVSTARWLAPLSHVPAPPLVKCFTERSARESESENDLGSHATAPADCQLQHSARQPLPASSPNRQSRPIEEMDLHVSQLAGLSVATHLSRELAKDSGSMPDGKTWRLGHNKQPKKPPKALTSLKVDDGTPIALEDSAGRRCQPSWRKTLQGSRPQTPVSTFTATTAVEDIEDARSDRSETSAPCRDSKPKLARYTSLFTTFKETAKETAKAPGFSEPWSDDAPLPFQPYIDPLNVVQSVRSHMANSSLPISPEHHSGLFRVFEDYRKVREQKERLESLLKETLQDWKQAEGHWRDYEDRYSGEIRRLELIIARGSRGMAGLAQARQGSIVNRKRRHRKTISHDSLPREYELLSAEKLDVEITSKSQKVLLHRSMSPSGKMAVLSKQFHNTMELQVGTPPDAKKKMTLSRKVQSELNLATMRKDRPSPSITSSVASAFSGGSGDSLPDEVLNVGHSRMQPTVECDALIALCELGALVARRRGLEQDSFNRSLMMLFSQTKPAISSVLHPDDENVRPSLNHTGIKNSPSENAVSQHRPMRKFQSQPQLSMQQKHRRQFSFEPGVDQLQALVKETRTSDAELHDVGSVCSDAPPLMHAARQGHDSHLTMSTSSTQNLSANFGKPSKIPSPVQTLGRSRQESSASSLQSIYSRPQDSRRGSRSSVLTAFRESSSGSLRPSLNSRNGSIQSLLTGDCPMSRDCTSGTKLRNNAITTAALTRVAGNESQTSYSEEGSLKPSASRAKKIEGSIALENAVSVGPSPNL